MIKDLKATADFISNWINDKAIEAGAKGLVVGISGGVDSALVAALCRRTNFAVYGVLMPCHSSPSSLARGNEVVNAFRLTETTIDLEAAFDAIAQPRIEYGGNISGVTKHGNVTYPPGYSALQNAARSALRSCLRAPTLDYISKLTQSIIVGTGNRDEDEVTRYFQKRGDGCVDISPIAKLHKSEVYELAAYLGVPESVLKATPSADLLGPDAGHEDEKELGMTYNEIETAMRIAESNIKDQGYLVHSLSAGDFERAMHTVNSPRMLKVLQTLANMERASGHKANPNLPVCNPRAIPGLII